MKALRAILLGLAVIVFAAVGWHLVEAPPAPSHGPALADNTVPVAPQDGTAAPAAPAQQPPPPPAEPTPPQPADQAASTPAPAPSTAAPPEAATPPAAPPAEATPPAPSAPAAAPVADEAATARAKLLAALKEAPDLDAVFSQLQADYPAVAEQALTAVAKPDASRPASPDDLVSTAMHDLRQSSGVLAAKAGPAPLSAIFDTQASILADLQQADARLCADYLFGGTSPEYADFAAGHRALMARMDRATLDAIADGRRAPVDRDAPTPEDFKQVETGLAAKGLSPDEIAALLDGKSLDPPPTDDRLCGNARAYLDVLHGLPEEVRMRIYGLSADLLARS